MFTSAQASATTRKSQPFSAIFQPADDLRKRSQPPFTMKLLPHSLLAILALTTFACAQNPGSAASGSTKGKSAAKTPGKTGARILSDKELKFAGDWNTNRWVGMGGEGEFGDKSSFLTLRKDGTFACKFTLDEKGNPQIHKAEGIGTWKLQSPKPQFWPGPFEGAEKGSQFKIPAKDEILVLALKGASEVKELKYLVGKTDGKLSIGLPDHYLVIEAVAK